MALNNTNIDFEPEKTFLDYKDESKTDVKTVEKISAFKFVPRNIFFTVFGMIVLVAWIVLDIFFINYRYMWLGHNDWFDKDSINDIPLWFNNSYWVPDSNLAATFSNFGAFLGNQFRDFSRLLIYIVLTYVILSQFLNIFWNKRKSKTFVIMDMNVAIFFLIYSLGYFIYFISKRDVFFSGDPFYWDIAQWSKLLSMTLVPVVVFAFLYKDIFKREAINRFTLEKVTKLNFLKTFWSALIFSVIFFVINVSLKQTDNYIGNEYIFDWINGSSNDSLIPFIIIVAALPIVSIAIYSLMVKKHNDNIDIDRQNFKDLAVMYISNISFSLTHRQLRERKVQKRRISKNWPLYLVFLTVAAFVVFINFYLFSWRSDWLGNSPFRDIENGSLIKNPALIDPSNPAFSQPSQEVLNGFSNYINFLGFQTRIPFNFVTIIVMIFITISIFTNSLKKKITSVTISSIEIILQIVIWLFAILYIVNNFVVTDDGYRYDMFTWNYQKWNLIITFIFFPLIVNAIVYQNLFSRIKGVRRNYLAASFKLINVKLLRSLTIIIPLVYVSLGLAYAYTTKDGLEQYLFNWIIEGNSGGVVRDNDWLKSVLLFVAFITILVFGLRALSAFAAIRYNEQFDAKSRFIIRKGNKYKIELSQNRNNFLIALLELAKKFFRAIAIGFNYIFNHEKYLEDKKQREEINRKDHFERIRIREQKLIDKENEITKSILKDQDNESDSEQTQTWNTSKSISFTDAMPLEEISKTSFSNVGQQNPEFNSYEGQISANSNFDNTYETEIVRNDNQHLQSSNETQYFEPISVQENETLKQKNIFTDKFNFKRKDKVNKVAYGHCHFCNKKIDKKNDVYDRFENKRLYHLECKIEQMALHDLEEGN